jgi:hypothetical protein
MSYAKLMLGGLIFCAAAAGFFSSVQAVNEAFPRKHLRVATDQGVSAIQKEDRTQPKDAASAVEHPREEKAETEPHLNRLCTSMDGKPFGWSWPNVPFAAMRCDVLR